MKTFFIIYSRICIITALLFIAFNIYLGAFVFSQAETIKVSNLSEEWQSLYNEKEVLVEYRYANCDMVQDGIAFDAVYLRIKNFSASPFIVSWELELKYGEKCYNCDNESEELKYKLELQPYEIMEGQCGDENKYHLRIFSKYLKEESETELSEFRIKNVKLISNQD